MPDTICEYALYRAGCCTTASPTDRTSWVMLSRNYTREAAVADNMLEHRLYSTNGCFVV
jgi:hypothetical protein